MAVFVVVISQRTAAMSLRCLHLILHSPHCIGYGDQLGNFFTARVVENKIVARAGQDVSGVRHALRPNTTIILAEREFRYPFDITSLVIRPYIHLGAGIDAEDAEVLRRWIDSVEVDDASRTGLARERAEVLRRQLADEMDLPEDRVRTGDPLEGDPAVLLQLVSGSR